MKLLTLAYSDRLPMMYFRPVSYKKSSGMFVDNLWSMNADVTLYLVKCESNKALQDWSSSDEPRLLHALLVPMEVRKTGNTLNLFPSDNGGDFVNPRDWKLSIYLPAIFMMLVYTCKCRYTSCHRFAM